MLSGHLLNLLWIEGEYRSLKLILRLRHDLIEDAETSKRGQRLRVPGVLLESGTDELLLLTGLLCKACMEVRELDLLLLV